MHCGSLRIFVNAEPLVAKHLGAKPPLPAALQPLVVRNNLDFYRDTNILSFFNEVGRHFRVSSMLTKDSVKSRMEQQEGINFTEFSYQIFQAYDFYRLYSDDGCTIQIGGSDQWGNITAGIELIRKLTGTPQDTKTSKAFGVTLPLVTNASGEKFGKSAGNAVWMENGKTSFFNFYQFFVRIPDLEVEKLLRLYTFLPLEQIDDVLKEHAVSPRPFVPIQTRVSFFSFICGNV